MVYRIILSFLFGLTLSLDFAQAQRTLTPESLLNIPRISEPRVSPDGKLIAFTRREVFLGENKTKAAIYIMPTAGGQVQRFSGTDENAYHPVWLTNNRLAFLSDKSGGTYNIW